VPSDVPPASPDNRVPGLARWPRLARDHRANEYNAPPTAHTAPPNRNHLPADESVMRMLPPAGTLLRISVTMNHPAAGSTPPRAVRIPHEPSTQVARIPRSNKIAASGAGPRLYWNVPISPCNRPSRNSARYAPTVTAPRLLLTTAG
jgi:hypothetical protein